jgi:hypothetical protein
MAGSRKTEEAPMADAKVERWTAVKSTLPVRAVATGFCVVERGRIALIADKYEDARLAACAPELLAALKRAVPMIEVGMDLFVAELEALIARAEGT